MTCANEPERPVKRAIQIKHQQTPRLRFKPAEYMKKIINAMRKIKASFSRRTTRHAFSYSLLWGWVLAAGLPAPVLGQNYSSPYTFTTIAGKVGSPGTADGTNSGARFSGLYALAVDRAGSLYGVEFGANTVRKVTPVGTNWVVTTLAGKAGISGSADGTGNAARFNFNANINNSGGGGYVVVDTAGNLYAPDFGNFTIRKGYPPLVVTSSGPGFGSNGGPFGFTLTGPTGQSVVVESSSDLVNWLPRWTNTLTFPAALTFRDPQSGVYPNRFYRAFTK